MKGRADWWKLETIFFLRLLKGFTRLKFHFRLNTIFVSNMMHDLNNNSNVSFIFLKMFIFLYESMSTTLLVNLFPSSLPPRIGCFYTSIRILFLIRIDDITVLTFNCFYFRIFYAFFHFCLRVGDKAHCRFKFSNLKILSEDMSHNKISLLFAGFLYWSVLAFDASKGGSSNS